MKSVSLASTIPINTIFNNDLIRKWNTAIADLSKDENIREISLEPNICRRYTFNFYGLLQYLGIEQQYYYPHLLINNYVSSIEYKGKPYTIKLIDLGLLENYYTAFLK